jgi:hypothetical protein
MHTHTRDEQLLTSGILRAMNARTGGQVPETVRVCVCVCVCCLSLGEDNGTSFYNSVY